MNLIKRLLDLSVDDLQRLQSAILKEIRRRKELSDGTAPPDDGAVIDAEKFDTEEQAVPASKPIPAAAKPGRTRRAA
jgi:hypothetical protein